MVCTCWYQEEPWCIKEIINRKEFVDSPKKYPAALIGFMPQTDVNLMPLSNCEGGHFVKLFTNSTLIYY